MIVVDVAVWVESIPDWFLIMFLIMTILMTLAVTLAVMLEWLRRFFACAMAGDGSTEAATGSVL